MPIGSIEFSNRSTPAPPAAGKKLFLNSLGDLKLLAPDGSVMSLGAGVVGTNGREVEFQKSATHIQWRYVGDLTWTDLVLLSDLEGTAGAAGAKGDKGDTGNVGPKGDTGVAGAAGEKGDKGDTGSVGPKGDTGSVGPKGDTGTAGATGAKGDKGDAGDKGDTGTAGATGAKGDKGDTGSVGPAPTGTGVVTVIDGVLQTPKTISQIGAALKTELEFPLPTPVVKLNSGGVGLIALGDDGGEGVSFVLSNFPTVVCNNLPIFLRQNTFVEIVIFKRKRKFTVPAPHIQMPWGDTYSNRVRGISLVHEGISEVINAPNSSSRSITMVRPNLYPALHNEVINVSDYLNGRWRLVSVPYNTYTIEGQNVNRNPQSIELLCPLPIHGNSVSDFTQSRVSKFTYSSWFAPLKFAFRYVHWANGEIFEGPLSNTYKIWYRFFPFRLNHYYSSRLGSAVSEPVFNPNHSLKCTLA